MKPFNSNKHSFKVPTNYFETLESDILMKPKKIRKEEGFRVPENYFPELEEKIVSTSIQSSQPNNLRKLVFTISSIAASLLIVVAVYFSFFIKDNKEVNTFTKNTKDLVDDKTEEAVYESLYKTYFVEDTKKSSNDITLDDLEDFYAER